MPSLTRTGGLFAALIVAAACRDVESTEPAPAPPVMSAASCETCIARAGEVVCWGESTADRSDTGAPRVIPLPGEATLVSISDDHGCALVGGDGVYCWGFAGAGQLGVDPPVDITSPLTTPVKSAFSPLVTRLTAGSGFTCALLVGTVQCVGGQQAGVLGNGDLTQTSVPVAIPGLGTVVDVQAGSSHACALQENGDVYCWGANENGEAGQDPTQTNSLDVATRVEQVSGADRLFVGPNTSCAHTKSGTTWCWGNNQVGLFGQPGPLASTPTQTSLDEYASIGIGFLRGVGLTKNGTVDGWGVALSATADLTPVAPAPIPGIEGATAVVAGEKHACAFDGSKVVCWGDNQCHQLGSDAGEFSADPVEVARP